MANGISPDELSCGMNEVFGKRAEYSDEHFGARAYKPAICNYGSTFGVLLLKVNALYLLNTAVAA